MFTINYKEDNNIDYAMFLLRYNKKDFDKRAFLLKYFSDEELSYYQQQYCGYVSASNIGEIVNEKNYRGRFSTIANTQEYQTYLFELRSYKEKLIENFEANKPGLRSYLSKVLKNDDINKTVDLYVTNPYCHGGYSDANTSSIYFGGEDGLIRGDKSYEVVYITHELLHILYPYKNYISEKYSSETKEKYDTIHAVIESIADTDLGVILNGKPYQSHDDIDYLRKEVYLNYKEYLNSSKYSSLDEFIKDELNIIKDNVNDVIGKTR